MYLFALFYCTSSFLGDLEINEKYQSQSTAGTYLIQAMLFIVCWNQSRVHLLSFQAFSILGLLTI